VVPATKLVPPRLPHGLVSRSRLYEHLAACVAQRTLTLVAATAGSGKTVLLAAWLASEARPTRAAWVSLDARDDEPRRFWTTVLAALRRSGATRKGSALPSLVRPSTGAGDEFLARLINGLGDLREDVVLVLDDFH
jgi:LuxR family maltose regulon positive regulatory protein